MLALRQAKLIPGASKIVNRDPGRLVLTTGHGYRSEESLASHAWTDVFSSHYAVTSRAKLNSSSCSQKVPGMNLAREVRGAANSLLYKSKSRPHLLSLSNEALCVFFNSCRSFFSIVLERLETKCSSREIIIIIETEAVARARERSMKFSKVGTR